MSNVSWGSDTGAGGGAARLCPMVPPDRPLRRAPVAVALLASLLLATGCTSAATSAGPSEFDAAGNRTTADVADPRAASPGRVDDDAADDVTSRPRTVAMVGDSITVSATEPLHDELAALDLEVVAIDAQGGRRMTVGERDRLYTGADIVAVVQAQSSPDLWVVALGTNDIGQYGDRERIVEQIETLLDGIPDDTPVVWVDTWWRTRPDDAAEVNDAIRSVVDARPGSIVVDWGSHATADGVVAGDGVHLTAEVGTRRFAEVVADGVESLIGPPT